MELFANLRLSRKLNILIAAFALGIAGFGLVVRDTLETVKVNGPLYQSIVSGKDLIADVLPPPAFIIEAYFVVLRALEEGEPSKVESLLADLKRLRNDYADRQRYWSTNLEDGEMKRLMTAESSRSADAFFVAAENEVFPALLAKDREKARAVEARVLRPQFEAHRASIERLVAAANKKNGDAEKTALATVASRNRLAYGVAVGCLVLSLILGVAISRSISVPLKRAVELATALARTGDTSSRLALSRGDELGDLARALDDLAQSLDDKAAEAEAIEKGDLTVVVSKASERDRLGSAFFGMVQGLESTVRQIEEAVGQVASAAQEISDASQSLSQSATEQASSLEEITSSSTEIGAQAKTSAGNAGAARTLVGNAREAAERGDREMKAMIGAMNEISGASKQIASVMKAIDDIAFQTNLLALNAAVEAARAGKHGKGFAVVAEEVRNLAGKSARAARETAGLIEDSTKKVDVGLGVARSTSEAFGQILETIVKTSDLVGEIAVASDEQAQGIGQISQGLGQLDQVTQRNTASAEETASASEELASNATRVRKLLSRFEIRRNA
jgi:methyl-accepting chemotaxis protein